MAPWRAWVDALRRWAGLRALNAPLGRLGEDCAARYLKRQGYAILKRNAVFGRYELDIIAREGDTIAFIEVKTRRPGQMAEPQDNLTPQKRRHIQAAARHYLSLHDEPDAYYRYDVVCIEFPETGEPEITLFRDAFQEKLSFRPPMRPARHSRNQRGGF